MEEEIEKMKTLYDLKIANCDKAIEQDRKAISICRKQKRDEDAVCIRKSRAISQAQRQGYVQAKYDFDSLLDFI